MKKSLQNTVELYPTFCPAPENVIEEELKGVVQRCEHCGYVFTRIDEDTGMSRKKLDTNIYKFPFGKEYSGLAEAVECYRIALTAREAGAGLTAAKWFINAAVLLEGKYQRKCYQNAFLLLELWVRSNCSNKVEVMLAYLNIMRLLGMYECVKESGKLAQKYYVGIERQLLERIVILSEKKNNSYMTYLKMLTDE